MRNNTNKRFLVIQVGPCPKCGFYGKINDWEEAHRRGVHSVIIDCPECNGRGELRQEVPIEVAFAAFGLGDRVSGPAPPDAPAVPGLTTGRSPAPVDS